MCRILLNCLRWPLNWIKLLGRLGTLGLQPVGKLVVAALLAWTRVGLLGSLLLSFKLVELLWWKLLLRCLKGLSGSQLTLELPLVFSLLPMAWAWPNCEGRNLFKAITYFLDHDYHKAAVSYLIVSD